MPGEETEMVERTNQERTRQLVRQESEFIMKQVHKDMKKLSPKKRAKKREEITTQSLFSRCEEVKDEDFDDEERLDRGDFLIARIVWDLSMEKYHDHWTIVKERYFI